MANQYGSPDIDRAALWQVLDTIWDYSNPATTVAFDRPQIGRSISLGVALLTFQQHEILKRNSWKRARLPTPSGYTTNDTTLRCRSALTLASLLGSKVDASKFIVPLID
jgi:hypothetical protein